MMSYSAGRDHGCDNQPIPINNAESIKGYVMTVEFGDRATVANSTVKLEIIFDCRTSRLRYRIKASTSLLVDKFFYISYAL